MSIANIFLILAIALLCGCMEERIDSVQSADILNDHAVSGPSWCKEMTPAHEQHLRSLTYLEAYRELREYYADCDLDGKHTDDLLTAAQGAARLGNQSDKQDYQQWQSIYGRSEDAGDAP
jgi:hypothetical protein